MTNRARVAIGVAFCVGAASCDPAVGVVVTNECATSVWVRVGGNEEQIARQEPVEVRPSASRELQSTGSRAKVGVSGSPESVGATRDVSGDTTITVRGGDCPSG